MATSQTPQTPAAHRVELAINGMTCASCANRIEKKLNKINGVTATVNYATEKATVSHTTETSVDELIVAVKKAGYSATLPKISANDPGISQTQQALNALRNRLLVSALLSLPVIVLAMVPALQFPNWQWASLTLAAPVVVWGAWPFHTAAWKNARSGNATMDTLVSVGTLAAFSWSLYALFFGSAGEPGMTHPFRFTVEPMSGTNSIYLEVAAGVTTFILAGRYLEHRSKRRSGAALQALLELGAKNVSVLKDGAETFIPIEQLTTGQHFVVRPGEKIATDGVIIEGSSALDTSLVTGESIPIEVIAGETIVGGSVNVGGRLVVRATRVGAETHLAQLARLVEQAQTGKTQVQRLADRIAGVFVPAVIVLSVATLGFWIGTGSSIAAAFTAAVAVLIIACPCALGLATPTALLVGTGRGAQLGTVIKGPEILESTRKIDTIVLDKTGTITTGVMALIEVIAADGEERNEVLRLAGAVEQASEHPIGTAITKSATHELGQLPAVTGFTNLAGLGVRATIGKHEVLVGQPKLLADHNIVLPDTLIAAQVRAQQQGHTVIAVSWDGQARGLVTVADTLKPNSVQAIKQFRELGLTPVLLTGDNSTVACSVADEVGISEVIAEVTPIGKVEVIKRLQQQGKVVAMAGDGVNDAAALAQADLGLAMGTGTDAAIHASDVTLVSGDLRAAADAIRLSRATLATIKGNLFWAFAYNVAAVPLAAAGLLNPMIAGAAMAFSSVLVVTNSLRLRHFKTTVSPIN